jgi:hypothetical protein
MEILRGSVACLCVTALLVTSRPIAAQSERAEAALVHSPAPPPLLHAFGASALLRALDGKDLGYGAQLDYRLRWPSEYQLGFGIAALALEADRIGGFAAKHTRRLEASALGVIPLGRTGPLGLDLRIGAGYAALHSAQQHLVEDRGHRLGLSLALIGNIRVASRVSLRLGFSTPFAFEIAPAGELATQGALVLTGVGVALTRSLLLRGDVESGGLFGFDGDGTKYETRASLSLRWVSGEQAEASHAL